MSTNGKCIKQGYPYHKLHKALSKFYHRHSVVKYNVQCCFKTSSAASATGHIRARILL